MAALYSAIIDTSTYCPTNSINRCVRNGTEPECGGRLKDDQGREESPPLDDLEVLGRAVHAVDWTHATILFSEDAGRNDISILSFSRIFVLLFFYSHTLHH